MSARRLPTRWDGSPLNPMWLCRRCCRPPETETSGFAGRQSTALGLIQKKAWIDQQDVRLAIVAAGHDPSLHVREMGLYAFWATAEISPGFSRALLTDKDVATRRMAVNALARQARLAKRARGSWKRH